MDTQTSTPAADWHPADVKAALEKKGKSLRALAREYGYSHIQRVLTSPWLAAEQIVATALGVPPESIWPSRYLVSRERGERLTRNSTGLKLVRKSSRRRQQRQEREAA